MENTPASQNDEPKPTENYLTGIEWNKFQKTKATVEQIYHGE